MEQAVYTIRTITNLHMGDIGSAVNIIDKSVQKDAVTEYPTIYATSLKGALRNAAAPYNAAQSEEKINLKTVFGDTNADGVKLSVAHVLVLPSQFSSSAKLSSLTVPATYRSSSSLDSFMV